MAKRKQEPIFSRLKDMEAELPPEKQQVEDSAQETHTAVSAGIIEENAGRGPEPVKTEGKACHFRRNFQPDRSLCFF